jgi:hypothetical protein
VRLEVFDVAAVVDSVAASEGERGATAQTAAAKTRFSAAVAADLPVQAEPQMAYVLLEEPLAATENPVNASVWYFMHSAASRARRNRRARRPEHSRPGDHRARG